MSSDQGLAELNTAVDETHAVLLRALARFSGGGASPEGGADDALRAEVASEDEPSPRLTGVPGLRTRMSRLTGGIFELRIVAPSKWTKLVLK